MSFRQNPFKLSEVSDSSKIAREPTPFGRGICVLGILWVRNSVRALSRKPKFDTNINF